MFSNDFIKMPKFHFSELQRVANLVSELPDDQNVDIIQIRERLINGDLTAVQELDKLNISYELTQNGNSFTIAFSYNGVKYTVKYNGKDSADNTTPSADSTPTPLVKRLDPDAPIQAGPIELVVATHLPSDTDNGTQTPPDDSGVSSEKEMNAAQAAGYILDAIDETLEEKVDNIAAGHKNIHTEFGMSNDGNIVFQEESTQTVFNNIVAELQKQISKLEKFGSVKNILENLGGEEVLKKLVQNAWIVTYNSFDSSRSNNTEAFVETVLQNLQAMMKKIEVQPESLELFTSRSCYADTTLTEGVIHYNTNTTYGEDETIAYGNTITRYSDGTVHISNNKDDNDYQTSMKQLLEKILSKYPEIDESFLEEIFRQAQYDALKAAQDNKSDCPYGTGNNNSHVEDSTKNWGGRDSRRKDGGKIHMDKLIQLTLYNFDKLFIQSCIANDIPPRTVKEEETANEPSASAPTDSTKAEEFAETCDTFMYIVDDALSEKVDNIVDGHKNIHTEFGMDSEGNIVFQEESTKEVYDNVSAELKKLISKYERYGNDKFKDLITKLGGEDVLNKLIQAAWINTYNAFDSSRSNNAEAFVEQVLENLLAAMEKFQTNPEYLEIFTKHTAYADTSLTEGLPHYNTKDTYGDDERIKYSGEITRYSDGSVHISHDRDDGDYQTSMNALLNRVLEKYGTLDADLVTTIFRQAQYDALKAAQNNRRDCPNGTGNNKGRVEDSTRNWGGNDSRKGDGSKIDMDQLIQLTLYYFDKLLYQELLKV